MTDSDRLFRWLPGMVMIILLGCQHQTAETATQSDEASPPTPASSLEPGRETMPKQTAGRLAAVEAKDALFVKLSSRLKEVMQAEGPAAAINVCSREAIQIAESVGEEHGVQIGRTSFKLRNPKNAPREWARPLVDQRVETIQQVDLENGSLGVLFPIHLQVQCLMCHGGPNDLLDAVKPELASRYPDDAATGFKQGELRGWFWVEVPQ